MSNYHILFLYLLALNHEVKEIIDNFMGSSLKRAFFKFNQQLLN
jgi:hypothetical protein